MSSSQSSQSLNISSASKKELTKTQKQFNTLTAKIEKLRRETKQVAAEVEALDQLFRKHIGPFQDKFALTKMEIAIALDKAALTIKLNKRLREDIGACIIDLTEDAMESFDRREDWDALYNRWKDCAYAIQKAEEALEESEMIGAMFGAMFGVDIDMDELRNDPNAADRIFAEMMEKETAARAQEAETRQSQKANARQSKRAAKEKAAADLQTKSLRSIYISLAKLLHPDLETDPALRADKEEQMKKVSAAYEANDLATLLQMEMEWLQKESDHLAKLPDDQLKVYIEVLKQQVFELEMEIRNIRWQSRRSHLNEYAYVRPETATRKMRARARELEAILTGMTGTLRTLQDYPTTKNVKAFVEEYVSGLEALMDDDFF